MICYKDMTFCSYYGTCSNGITCRRALTKDIADRAQMAGLPISQFTEEPDCYNKKESE